MWFRQPLLPIPVMAEHQRQGNGTQSKAAPKAEGSLWETALGACEP